MKATLRTRPNGKEGTKSMATYSADAMIKTNRKVRITFSGWDGKSYNGEGRNLTVYKHPFIDGDFVRGYFKGDRCYHKVTDRRHPVSGELEVDFFTVFYKD